MGERDDFEGWATEAAGPLFRHALMLTADRHLAEDLVQETLTKMYIHWHRIDHAAYPLAYAKQTLYRQFVTGRRRRAASELVTDAFPHLAVPEWDGARSIDLRRALGRLTATERAVVIARYSEGMGSAEVATLLGRSDAWVRKTASRALAKLRASSDLAPEAGRRSLA
ncbi:MAG: sigma-70 family RNA polymerase sigma factor [Arachnia sp.]